MSEDMHSLPDSVGWVDKANIATQIKALGWVIENGETAYASYDTPEMLDTLRKEFGARNVTVNQVDEGNQMIFVRKHELERAFPSIFKQIER